MWTCVRVKELSKWLWLYWTTTLSILFLHSYLKQHQVAHLFCSWRHHTLLAVSTVPWVKQLWLPSGLASHFGNYGLLASTDKSCPLASLTPRPILAPDMNQLSYVTASSTEHLGLQKKAITEFLSGAGTLLTSAFSMALMCGVLSGPCYEA